MKCLISIFAVFSLLTCHCQTTSSINHDGIDRDFVYYTPTTWNINQQVPLLIVLHGVTQTGSGVMGITDFNDIAEANNFIVCYPDGINNAWNANMNISGSTADDLGFIEELSTLFQNTLNTDPLKQYLCGFSNGGFMSHKIACESSQCFAAIATVSGNMSDTVDMNCNPSYPTSVLHIHGTSDPVVSYFGSPTTGVAVDTTIEKWRTFLACDVTPITTDMPNNNLFDFSYPQHIVYQNCSAGSLELIKVIDGGHQWPGIATLIGGLGNINMDFYSPQVIWEFLDGKSCPFTASPCTATISGNGLVLCEGDSTTLLAHGFCALDTASGFTFLGNFNGQNYYVSNTTHTWAASNAFASQYGADILTITSAAENTFIYDSIQSIPGTNLWLGAYGPTNTSFSWLNGEPFVYSNWFSGEPSSNSEEFIEYYVNQNGEWNDCDTMVPGPSQRLLRLVLEIDENCGNTYLWSTGETSSSISVDQIGEYSVEITDEFACLAYDTVTVSSANMLILAQDTIICQGDTVQLVASAWSLQEEFTLVADMDPPDEYTFTSANTAGAYVLVVSGIFAGASNEARDAGYYFINGSGNPVVPPASSIIWDWNGVAPLTQSTMSPTEYNPDHIYYFYFDGGAPQTISMFPDPGATSDNSGSLTFQVYSIDGNVLWSTGEANDTIYVWPAQTTTYSVSMNYGSSICEDSITISVIPPYSDTVQVTNCEPYTWAQTGFTYSSSGFYYDSLSSVEGCDSVIVLELNIQDLPPEATCQNDETANSSDDGMGDCSTTVQVNAPGVFDDCEMDTTLAYIGGILVNVNTYIYPVGDTQIEWVAYDISGNTDTCYQLITVQDDEYPILLPGPPLSVQVDNDPGQCGAAVIFASPNFTDNCGYTVTQSGGNSGGFFPVGTSTVTWVAEDNAGNTSAHSISVIVDDAEVPSFTGCPNDTVLSASLVSCGINYFFPQPTVLDNCPGTTLQELGIPINNYFNVGLTVVSWIATDSIGNQDTCSFFVEVIDDTPPYFISCPNDITLEVGVGTCDRIANWSSISYFDNCGATLFQTQGIAEGQAFPLGITYNEFVITDAAGLTDTCLFLVTITDTTAPVIVCPGDIIVNNVGPNCGAQLVNYSAPSSSDNCTTVTNQLIEGLSSGTVFPLGTTLITYVASDDYGNTDTCSFTITVNDPLPPPAPIDTINGPIEICDDINAWYSISSVANATDVNWTIIGGEIITPTFGENMNNKYINWLSPGANQIIVEAYNICYSVFDTLNVTVYEAPYPVDAGPDSITICEPITTYTLQAVLPFVGVGSWSVIQGGATVVDPSDPSSLVINLTDTNIFRWTVINDICERFSDILIMPDQEAPVALCNNITVYMPPQGFFTVTPSQIDAGSTDNCYIQSMTLTNTNITCASGNPASTSLIVTDSLGNSSSCNAFITIIDTVPPDAICQDISIQLNSLGEYTMDPQAINGGSLDNCLIDSVLASQTSFTCADVGSNSVTLLIVDGSGNTDTCQATVTVVDSDGPVIGSSACVNVTVALDSSGLVTVDPYDLFAPGEIPSDPCGLASVTLSPTNVFNCDDVGDNIVIITATDQNGNSSQCGSVVTVVDNMAPVAICMDTTIVLQSSESYFIAPNGFLVDGGSYDNCPITYGSLFPAYLDCSDAGQNTVTMEIIDENMNSSSCDAVITLVYAISSVSDTAVCDSLVWNGQTIDTSGSYSFASSTSGGCDSTANINVIVNYSDFHVDVITACEGYTWIDGVTYSNSTSAPSVTYTNLSGCDSTIALDLTINYTSSGSASITACDSYTWSASGTTYTSSGSFSEVLTNLEGCDSTATLNLTINYANSGSASITACDSYNWSANGTTYTSSGSFTEVLTNLEGCDSTATLNLTVNYASSASATETVCDTYTAPDSAVYTSTGMYTAILPNAAGCDSTITIDLTVNNATVSSVTETACDTYTAPDGAVYTSTGMYTAIISNAAGCDSTITIDLTVNNASSGSASITACNSYTWSASGVTYTSSGSFTEVLTNLEGCDSTATLNLTINYANSGSASITACDSYTWSANGTTYTSSGSFTEVLTNLEGCDSTATLNLTINYANSGSASITACNSYTWSASGVTYTSSGSFTEVLTNVQGCDSTATLSLTINYASSGSATETACDTYTAPDGAVYTSTGMYTAVIPNAAGCDSTITIDLTVNNATSSSISETALDSYTAPGGAVYTTSGVFNDTIPNAAGCDSVITITLTMNHTGIEELNHRQIILTPNPTSDFITIEGIENVTGIKSMELVSSAGRVVAELKVGTVKIDVSMLSSGSYFLSITHAKGTERLRFVKE